MAYDPLNDASQFSEGSVDEGVDLTDEEISPKVTRHQITARDKTKKSKRRIFNVALAAGTVLALQILPFSPFSFTASGAIIMGASVFMGKKLIDKGYSVGKKHFIKAREQGDKKSVNVMRAMEAASIVVPLMLLGSSPITLVAGGIAALTYRHKNHQWFDKYYRSKKEAKNAKQR